VARSPWKENRPEKLLSAPANDFVRKLLATPRRQADEVEALVSAGSNGDRQ
jgi:hypothetical protein